MASEVSKRRFRFSLTTLLVAVNVAGVLVWANVRVHKTSKRGFDSFHRRAFYVRRKSQGWPWLYRHQTRLEFVERTGLSDETKKSETPQPYRFLPALIPNIATGILVILYLVWVIEYLARRIRKAREHEADEPNSAQTQ